MNNRQLKPYAELFEYHPENIYQKPLGSLMGFFEMKDYSKDSEYIVNFLTSVLKKEYYANPKRSATESFDSALHKVNVALSEIAKHGNINWLGKIDAAICVMEQNTIHFSVTGNGHVYIKRQDQFMSISDALAPDQSDPHPLKTFVDVSSGKTESGDRVLIFSDDIFQILPLEKLGKSVLRYDRTKFAQFMKTALSNELEMTCAIIVEVFKKENPIHSGLAIIEDDDFGEEFPLEEFNAFSQKTYAQKTAPTEIHSTPSISEEVDETKEYTDKKTGHIYIQGDGAEQLLPERTPMALLIAKEKITDITTQSKQEARRIFLSVKKKFSRSKNIQPEQPYPEKYQEEMLPQEDSTPEQFSEENDSPQRKIAMQEEPAQKVGHVRNNTHPHKEEDAPMKTELPSLKKTTESPSGKGLPILQRKLTLQEKIMLAKQQIIDGQAQQNLPENPLAMHLPQSDTPTPAKKEKPSYLFKSKLEKLNNPPTNKNIKEESTSLQNNLPVENEPAYESRLSEGASRFLNPIIAPKVSLLVKATAKLQPRVTQIKQLSAIMIGRFNKLSPKQKIAVTTIVISGILTILFFQTQKTPPPTPHAAIEKPAPTIKEILSGDKNMVIDPDIQKISLTATGVAVLTLDNSPYIITSQKIFVPQDTSIKEYPIPASEGAAIGATVMKDLGIILIFTDQRKILSFSPVSQQFKSNSIAIPENFQPKFMGTYLTYLYLPDIQSNKIYRFPRTAGGFGEKTDWLKNGQRLPKISAMTLDDSIYFSDGSGISKYFKGEAQPMSLENSKTPISFNLIHTSTNSSFLYVLDTKNYRLIRYNKSGEIVRQYFIGDQIKNITSFTVDSHDEKVYLVSGNDIVSISL